MTRRDNCRGKLAKFGKNKAEQEPAFSVLRTVLSFVVYLCILFSLYLSMYSIIFTVSPPYYIPYILLKLYLYQQKRGVMYPLPLHRRKRENCIKNSSALISVLRRNL